MRFSFELGQNEKHVVAFSRSCLTGRLAITVDGDEILSMDPWEPATHYSGQLLKKYQFIVGIEEKHDVRIEHTRPLILSAFRKGIFRAFVDDKLFFEQCGY